MVNYLFTDNDALKQRPLSELETDKSALYALAQAAVNVELFTIPLYMASMYSIHGMHQINAKSNDFYRGRLWPGMGTTPGRPEKLSPNQDAFNKVFSVFIAEMLHLQMASNICTAIGYTPVFTSSALQNETYGWTCYGDEQHVIPHIVDLRDFREDTPYHSLKVKLDSLNATQINLFLAIEEAGTEAQKHIDPETWAKNYSPTVPFAGWNVEKTEADLPMFGTIGHMYVCLWEYLSIQYEDGSTLWSHLYVANSVQQDLFNAHTKTHQPEYPEMFTSIDKDATAQEALGQVLNMIDGITDQGEGKEVVGQIRLRLKLPVAKAVDSPYQPDEKNLAYDYPTYNDKGEQQPVSADTSARAGQNGGMDHYEIFTAVKDIIKQEGFETWDTWHQKGNSWNPADLITNEADYKANIEKYPQLPLAEDIANALNNLKRNDFNANYTLLCHASAGALAGMTTVLNGYWKAQDATFPMPAMGGTGDRMSICWAIFGKAPDLKLGIPPKNKSVLYHACQGLNLDPSQPNDMSNCAGVEIYHTCIGSNDCRAQGGCGFVQSLKGDGSCSGGGSCSTKKALEVLCGQPSSCNTPELYSAPSDNKCGGFGGCAVPISASQMFPTPKGEMQLFGFVQDDDGWHAQPLRTYAYQEAELVYDVAWTAYTQVLEAEGKEIPEKPKPSDIRLAFPPST